MKYLIRACKYLVYFFVLFLVMVTILWLLSPEKSQGLSVTTLFKEGSIPKILAFFACIAALYPKFAFVQRKVYLNGTFEESRDLIVEVFENFGYGIECEGAQAISFRLNKTSMRFSRMWEDRVTINITDNPIIVDGYRKDIDRIVRRINSILQQQ